MALSDLTSLALNLHDLRIFVFVFNILANPGYGCLCSELVNGSPERVQIFFVWRRTFDVFP